MRLNSKIICPNTQKYVDEAIFYRDTHSFMSICYKTVESLGVNLENSDIFSRVMTKIFHKVCDLQSLYNPKIYGFHNNNSGYAISKNANLKFCTELSSILLPKVISYHTNLSEIKSTPLEYFKGVCRTNNLHWGASKSTLNQFSGSAIRNEYIIVCSVENLHKLHETSDDPLLKEFWTQLHQLSDGYYTALFVSDTSEYLNKLVTSDNFTQVDYPLNNTKIIKI